MKPFVSVAINTLNEEKNLKYALRSVRPWAQEIVVVDMHSDDGTAAIARQFAWTGSRGPTCQRRVAEADAASRRRAATCCAARRQRLQRRRGP